MKIAVITVAGISSRFNEGILEDNKKLKAIYYVDDSKNTLLYHLILKCLYADRIIIVGGYKFDILKNYVLSLGERINSKIDLIKNDHYENLGSGYSLYLGLNQAFAHEPSEVLFVEGDLDIDNESFKAITEVSGNVLTYTYEPIYSNKAVVLYKDAKEHYRYAFNNSHGLLMIADPFSCIFNSGQIWKFTDMKLLKQANHDFYTVARQDTNLRIIQNYLDAGSMVNLMPLKRWTNCNTRSDYKRIVAYWESEI